MKNPQVLLVDGDERFRSSTRSLLEARGVAVCAVDGGKEALREMEHRRFDVVLLDATIPDMDGAETMRLIKQRFPLVEVIILTGHDSVDAAAECLRAGAFDYIVKPCDISALVIKVREAALKKKDIEDQHQKRRIERIISHPMAVFERDEREGESS
ncbi:MAG: response regulator [Thermodesulfobacteriota bacterium]